jgi:hypothetical protein
MKQLTIIISLLALSACGHSTYQYSAGPKGDTGATGATGDTGAAGQNGTNGTNGTNATPVTFVKFCPGVTVYPSKFVEGGFCINGSIYATYSANGGFTSEMPPGMYGSSGINASCNFTIGLNCTIISQ